MSMIDSEDVRAEKMRIIDALRFKDAREVLLKGDQQDKFPLCRRLFDALMEAVQKMSDQEALTSHHVALAAVDFARGAILRYLLDVERLPANAAKSTQ